jgi:hypothetical protein
MPKRSSSAIAQIAVVVISLAAAAAAFAASGPITSDQFAPDWQQQARSLINRGPLPGTPLDRVGSNTWYVPSNLPRGHYFVIERHDNGSAELIDGYVFDVTSDPVRDIHLVLPLRYSDVLAIPAELVPGVTESPPKVRFEGP